MLSLKKLILLPLPQLKTLVCLSQKKITKELQQNH